MKFGITRRFIVVTFFLMLVIVMLGLLVVRPWSNPLSVPEILERVQIQPSATGETTYRIQDVTREIISGKETVFNTEVSYSSPDRVHYIRSTDQFTFEDITIGDIRYQRKTGEPSQPGNSVSILCTSNTSFEKTFLELVERLEDVERLPDEEVNDILCSLIQGNYVAFSFQEYLEGQGDRYSEEEIQTILENVGQDEIVTIQIWISKKSFNLVKLQMESSHQSGDRNSSLIATYYDFGKPLDITAPFDKNGNILPGWHVVDDTYLN